MNTPNNTHNLIEYVLTLLSLPEYNIADIGQQVSQDALADNSFFGILKISAWLMK